MPSQQMCSKVLDLEKIVKSIYSHKYYLTHKEHASFLNKKWKDRNIIRFNKYHQEYRTTNREILNKKYRLKALENKREVINHYSNGKNKCQLCDFNNLNALIIDHINGGGNVERKKLNNYGGVAFYALLIKNNFPNGYRVLCWNCNHLEHLRKINYGGLTHERL